MTKTECFSIVLLVTTLKSLGKVPCDAKKTCVKTDPREQELMMLRKVAEYVSSNLELEELLGRIVKMVTEITSADSCFIYLYDAQRNELA